jgi:hypothetical protein
MSGSEYEFLDQVQVFAGGPGLVAMVIQARQ